MAIRKPSSARFDLAVAGLAALLLAFASCSKEAAETAAPPPLAVRVARVEPRPMEVALEVTGSLVSSVAVDVKTEFAGRVVAMLKQSGDRVARGELLAQLEDANARLSLGQARASLEVAQATLARTKLTAEHAQTEFERAENLLKTGGITDRDFQAAQSAERDGRAQVKLAEAQVEQARQSVALAEKHLHDCQVLSPITGEVERKVINPGGWVDASALLYRLVDNQRLELETYIASSDLARIRTGQTIQFSVAAYPDETFVARINHISAGVDIMNRSVPIRAVASNPGGKLKAGMFVKGRVITGIRPHTIVVAPDAVWRRSGHAAYVYVVESRQAKKREVRLGREDTGGIEISEGLRSGDTVILEQNLELAEGVAVVPRS